jgi:WD domain, G-beta repeat
VRAGTGFHADKARRQSLEKRNHLAAPELLPDDDLLGRIGTGAGTAGDAIEGGHNNDVLSAGFSADAKRVVTGSRDYTLRVWDLEGRRRLAVLSDVYEDDVVSAVFSPVNPSLVASASTDGSAHIWNVDTNTITALKGHNGPVWSIAFNSNGRQIVTASGDTTARVWDAESGQLVQTFKGHSNWVFSAAFTAGDKHVVTASRDKTVRIWDVETGNDVTGGVVSGSTQELVERAKERVPRCLTRDQREKAFLAAEPPAWCIEMEKWPYHTQDWKDWLRFKKANADPPLPDTPEWQPWIAAHRLDRG